MCFVADKTLLKVASVRATLVTVDQKKSLNATWLKCSKLSIIYQNNLIGVVLGPEEAFQSYTNELVLRDGDLFWWSWSQLSKILQKSFFTEQFRRLLLLDVVSKLHFLILCKFERIDQLLFFLKISDIRKQIHLCVSIIEFEQAWWVS